VKALEEVAEKRINDIINIKYHRGKNLKTRRGSTGGGSSNSMDDLEDDDAEEQEKQK